jgi:hypothetical protein
MEGQLSRAQGAQARQGSVKDYAWPPPAGQAAPQPEAEQDKHDGINRDLIRLALHKITCSPEFAASIQLRQFLTFVVEATIADPPVPLKGYTIATQALGRDDRFNPATDPIVRVEAARLRRRLEDYYAGTGQTDPVRIIIPKGSYEPGFHLPATPSTAVDIPGEGETAAATAMTPQDSEPPALPHMNRPDTLTAEKPFSIQKPAFPAFLLHPAVFFPLMALAFAAGYAAARL